jgi:hypothetical protein
MGTKTIGGVWFQSYSHDHLPPHVHGTYGGVRVIVDLLPDGTIRESKRWNAVTPMNAKRSDVRHVLRVAAENVEALQTLWEKIHGSSSK